MDLSPYLAPFQRLLTIDGVRLEIEMTAEEREAFRYMVEHKLIAATSTAHQYGSDRSFCITPKGMNWDCQNNTIDHSKYGWKEER